MPHVLARDAAVAFGLGDYAKADELLEQLELIVKAGPKEYVKSRKTLTERFVREVHPRGARRTQFAGKVERGSTKQQRKAASTLHTMIDSSARWVRFDTIDNAQQWLAIKKGELLDAEKEAYEYVSKNVFEHFRLAQYASQSVNRVPAKPVVRRIVMRMPPTEVPVRPPTKVGWNRSIVRSGQGDVLLKDGSMVVDGPKGSRVRLVDNRLTSTNR